MGGWQNLQILQNPENGVTGRFDLKNTIPDNDVLDQDKLNLYPFHKACVVKLVASRVHFSSGLDV